MVMLLIFPFHSCALSLLLLLLFSGSVVSYALCDPMHCRASLSFTISWSLVKLMSTESVISSNHLILCCPLLLSSIFPSIRVFSSESVPSGGQSIGASASASVLPTNIQGSFPLGLTGLISFLSRRLSRVFSSTTVQKHQFFSAQPSLWFSCHIRTWLLWKPELWLYGPLLAKKRLCFLICCLGLS